MAFKIVKPAGIHLIIIHIIFVLSLFYVEFSWKWIALCAFCYYLRMFAITAGFHRLFSHKSYRTGRFFQFVLGFLGTSSLQRGPLWWAGVHRHHHRYSDTEKDIHSPVAHGLWESHIGWVMNKSYKGKVDLSTVQDLSKFPELVWLDRYYLLPAIIFALTLFLWGGLQAFLWGTIVSTVLLWHGTFTVNSVTHVFGSRRFETKDQSRNNWIVALLTLGEGWHNNHHFYPRSVRQGFVWWELDISYYLLRILSWLGIVRDLQGTNLTHILPLAKKGNV